MLPCPNIGEMLFFTTNKQALVLCVHDSIPTDGWRAVFATRSLKSFKLHGDSDRPQLFPTDPKENFVFGELLVSSVWQIMLSKCKQTDARPKITVYTNDVTALLCRWISLHVCGLYNFVVCTIYQFDNSGRKFFLNIPFLLRPSCIPCHFVVYTMSCYVSDINIIISKRNCEIPNSYWGPYISHFMLVVYTIYYMHHLS